MPIMDSLARTIRSQPAFAKIPIIAMTANAMSGDREKVIAAACGTTLQNPQRQRDVCNAGQMDYGAARRDQPKSTGDKRRYLRRWRRTCCPFAGIDIAGLAIDEPKTVPAHVDPVPRQPEAVR
jgi:CheY-like chemotaxis protein